MNEQEFWAAIDPLSEPKPIFYRLYHDDQGNPLFLSQEDLPGKYIELDRKTYINLSPRARVVDGKLVVQQTTTVSKLAPSQYGTPCHTQDVSIVVSETQPHIKWSLK